MNLGPNNIHLGVKILGCGPILLNTWVDMIILLDTWAALGIVEMILQENWIIYWISLLINNKSKAVIILIINILKYTFHPSPFKSFILFCFCFSKGPSPSIFGSSLTHGCQNPNLDPTILRFYDHTYLKWSRSFKDLYDRSRSIGLYDSDNSNDPSFL